MNNRFSREKTHAGSFPIFVSACLFAAVLLVFGYGVSSVSGRTEQEESRTLEEAVARGITYCYAAEGRYPTSLSYLKEHYGLFYDENKFFIDYQPMGANIMPDVTIIRKKDN